MRLHTLGGLELSQADFTRPKPLLLLAYLALEGHKDRRYLSELFWPGAANPMASLRVALTQLRSGVPGALSQAGGMLGTNLQSDAVELLRMLERNPGNELSDLYGGAFLAGVYLPDWSSELEEWVYVSREFIADKVRSTLLCQAEGLAADGDFAAATKSAERAYRLPGAAELEPDILPRLYSLLCAGGSLETSRLKQEADPYGISLELTQAEARTQLYRRPVPAETKPLLYNVSKPATSFVGRDPELMALADLLAQPDTRLITLLGAGGTGKSRLALQVAQEFSRVKVSGGVAYVSLASLNDPALIPTAIASTLGLNLQGSDAPLAQVQRFLGDEPFLLILDNYEHLMAGATLVSALLAHCAGLKVLVTSRERLNVQEEQLFEVEGLPLPNESLTLADAQYQDAVQLFVQRARRVNLEFNLTPENLAAVIQICRLLWGSPLGIELAATWLRLMSAQDIAEELGNNLDFLTSRARNIPDRQQSLRATFDYSWNLLTPKEQAALGRLAVFAGGFSREAAAKVAGASIPLLVALVDKSLLRVLPNSRFERQPLVYRFTLEKLAEQPEALAETSTRHADFYFAWLEQTSPALWGAEAAETLNLFDRELDNIRSAWQWAVNHQHAEHLQTDTNLVVYFDRRARYTEGIALFALAVHALDENNPAHHLAISKLLVDQAWLTHRLGLSSDVITLAERAEELARPLGKTGKLTLMKALNTHASAATQSGDYQRAKIRYEQALSLARQHGEATRIATYLTNLANVETNLGDIEDAETHFAEALAIHRERKDAFGETIDLYNLGNLVFEQFKETGRSHKLLVEGLALARRLNFKQAIPYFLNHLATLELQRGNYQHAEKLALEALDLSRISSNSAIEAAALQKLGRRWMLLEVYTEAEAYLAKSLTAGFPNHLPQVLEVLIYLAELRIRQKQYQQACELLGVALHHPVIKDWAQGMDEVSRVLAMLKHYFPADKLASVLEDSRGLLLEDVVSVLLAVDSPIR